MKTTFQATAEDLLAAYRLYYLHWVRRKRTVRGFVIGAVLVGAGSTWLFSDDLSLPLAALIGVAYWTGLLVLLVGLNLLLLPRRTRRIYTQQKSLHGHTEVEWSEAGISFQAAKGASNFQWADFVRLVEGRDTLLLMQSDALFNFIPRSSLSSDQAASIIAFASAKH